MGEEGHGSEKDRNEAVIVYVDVRRSVRACCLCAYGCAYAF